MVVTLTVLDPVWADWAEPVHDLTEKIRMSVRTAARTRRRRSRARRLSERKASTNPATPPRRAGRRRRPPWAPDLSAGWRRPGPPRAPAGRNEGAGAVDDALLALAQQAAGRVGLRAALAGGAPAGRASLLP